jgi:hypothetical protein
VLSFLFYKMKNKLTRQKLFLFSILLMVLFTYPVISIVNKTMFIAGFPVLFLYVFVVWIIAIIVLYRLADRKQK